MKKIATIAIIAIFGIMFVEAKTSTNISENHMTTPTNVESTTPKIAEKINSHEQKDETVIDKPLHDKMLDLGVILICAVILTLVGYMAKVFFKKRNVKPKTDTNDTFTHEHELNYSEDLRLRVGSAILYLETRIKWYEAFNSFIMILIVALNLLVIIAILCENYFGAIACCAITVIVSLILLAYNPISKIQELIARADEHHLLKK